MLDLPIEILQNIGDFLDTSSLLSFSSVNRQCRLALSALLYRDIEIRFSSPETLVCDIQRCQGILASSISFHHVQHLRVVAAEMEPLSYPIDDCGDRPLYTWKFCGIDGCKTRQVIDNHDWQLLSHLMKSFPALQRLTWGCLERIPSCILDIIEHKVPRCWLDVENFHLSSLIQPSSGAFTIDSSDLEVATAQCLRSLVMRCDSSDSSEYINHNPQAILDMVSGAAPNLRTVRLLWPPGASTPAFNQSVILSARDRVLGVSTRKRRSMGRLENLELVEGGSGHALMSWNTKTDFNLLQTLKVHYPLVTSDFRSLRDCCRFQSLHTLAINLGVEDGENDPESDLADAVEGFLFSIPPLRSVKLTGDYSQVIVSSVLDHCNLSLQHLLLGPLHGIGTGVPATISFIHSMIHRCPNLEELAIPLMRCQGDASEVAVYRSLARLPALRKLHLSVYCKEPFLWDQHRRNRLALDTRIHDSEPGLEDQFRRAVVDLAVDQVLAAHIFEIITHAKSQRSAPLESLEIRTKALSILGGFSSTSKWAQWLQYISRSWTCTAKIRDDMRGQCHIVEYDDEERLDRQDIDELGEVDEILRTRSGGLLSKIWPGVDSRNWRTRWHSFPLSI
ncbi:hypothetical protein M436DRAFT_68360 [Aureobasidium namibiae CBS 147.97]|uniref:F-box domain-containing protein n=1 Tax=Aureobasidium namibiae CBS 147.97 TaxID=1043004 RepID=A0A074WE77_9PEZI|nr:uncharacterized protein M436DRAFT_68360 [Aureobasidium namibiae CBS 147.97]KEQ68192.1 hypothetical protein M436DRAFT_68360 [Aureobasidium namibiae CBS 147.97]